MAVIDAELKDLAAELDESRKRIRALKERYRSDLSSAYAQGFADGAREAAGRVRSDG